MKKLIAIFLAAALLCTLNGCRKAGGDDAPDTSEKCEATSEDSAALPDETTDTDTTAAETATVTENESVTEETTAAVTNDPYSSKGSSNSVKDTSSDSSPLSLEKSVASISPLETVQVEQQYEISEGYYDAGQESYPLRPCYNHGNCHGAFSGTQTVVMFFLDDNQSKWSAEEISLFTVHQINPALKYLTEQANRYGVSLNFNTVSYSTPLTPEYSMKYSGSVTEDCRVTGTTKDVIDNSARDLGYSSVMEMNNDLCAKLGTDHILYLNLINKEGISYTRHINGPGYTNTYEHCVLLHDFQYCTPGSVPHASNSSVIAHEILHLFGAEDFYIPAAREAYASKIYPDDIMLNQYYSLNRNIIGDLTAYSVGWTNTVPAACYQSEWWG